jgi:hypothetical protein
VRLLVGEANRRRGGGRSAAGESSVPEAKTKHVSKTSTNKLHIPAAEGGSTAGKNPVYDTLKLRASSDLVRAWKELG